MDSTRVKAGDIGTGDVVGIGNEDFPEITLPGLVRTVVGE